MAHELTHYFQWINSIKLTPIGKERQATNYADYVLEDYAETREHPQKRLYSRSLKIDR